MEGQAFFNSAQLKLVGAARDEAAALVTRHYCIAPREWLEMPYEVKTLRSLEGAEIPSGALAQTLCYSIRREIGSSLIEQSDLYCICLQDGRILERAGAGRVPLDSLLLYVMTHELVHVVRFGRQLQSLDLPQSLRSREEDRVNRTTRLVLSRTGREDVDRVLFLTLTGTEAN